MIDIPEIEVHLMLAHLIQIAISYLLALPIALNREREDRSAGLRTFPLVAIGACAYVLIGLEVLDGSESHARILYGLMAGIGFIGGGAILKDGQSVHGTATAASVWITGAIGASVAWSRYEIAMLLCVLTFFTLMSGRTFKKKISGC